jgi:hypothetical protein
MPCLKTERDIYPLTLVALRGELWGSNFLAFHRAAEHLPKLPTVGDVDAWCAFLQQADVEHGATSHEAIERLRRKINQTRKTALNVS